MLELNGIHLNFGDKTILSDLHCQLQQGEIGCLLGHSGCGKTTALRAVAGFEHISRGEIRIDGRTVAAAGQHMPAHQRGVGMVFQDYALFPHLNVADNITFGLHGKSAAERKARSAELLRLIDLEEHGHKYPHQLSGGQQQRVALARAMAPRPQLILLDEPFSNLDADMRASLSRQIRDILKEEGVSALLVTHDQQEAFAMCDQIGILHQGCLQQWADPYTLYHNPANRYVAAFVGQSVWLHGRVTSPQCVQLEIGEFCGTVPHHCQNCSEVDVLLRPDDVLHDDNSPYSARVLDKNFKGEYFIYTLQLDSGDTVLAQVHSHHNHPVGSRIGVRIALDHLIAFPRGV
ncbi:iron(III) transport system ATP-binding protein [Neisseria sp. HSC-16F19]|nr:ABC transporter ATP-binding protein [Neisseria sp. HSC-16F19]MCP2040922.1 iron(III) transport system ATP-binding protein [Neisseria sp. HSC-16F19]